MLPGFPVHFVVVDPHSKINILPPIGLKNFNPDTRGIFEISRGHEWYFSDLLCSKVTTLAPLHDKTSLLAPGYYSTCTTGFFIDIASSRGV